MAEGFLLTLNIQWKLISEQPSDVFSASGSFSFFIEKRIDICAEFSLSLTREMATA